MISWITLIFAWTVTVFNDIVYIRVWATNFTYIEGKEKSGG